MAPRKPPVKGKTTRQKAGARKGNARVRRTASGEIEVKRTSRPRARLIGESRNSSPKKIKDISGRAIAEVKAEAKGKVVTGRNGESVRVKPAQTAKARRVMDTRAITRDAIKTVQDRNVAAAGGDAAKALAARRDAAVYEAYINARQTGASEAEAKANAKRAGEDFDRAEKVRADEAKKTEAAKKTAAKKPAAKKTAAKKPASNAKPLSASEKAKMQASVDKTAKALEADIKEGAKGTPKAPAGETPANASGNKPAASVNEGTAIKKVETFTSQIQDVESEMKANRAALRSGTISQADFDAKKTELTGKKNELMKARKAVAKQAGISLESVKAEEGARPARNPKPKDDAPKAEKPKGRQTAARKTSARGTSAKPAATPKVDTEAVKKVDSKIQGAVQEYKDGKITRKQLVSRMNSLTDERLRLTTGATRPTGTAMVPSSGVKTRAEAVGRRGSKAVVKSSGVQYKADAITRKTGLTWSKAGSRLKGFLGKGLFGRAMVALTAVQMAELAAGLISDTGIVDKGMSALSAQSSGMTTLNNKGTANDPLGIKGGGRAVAKPKPKPPVSNKPEYPNIPNKYPAPKPAAPKKDYKGYRVKRGDTMWDIARDNGVTLEQLYKANPIIAKRTAAGKVDIFANTLVKIPKK